MLKRDVREAVAEGKFHIYPIRSIDEGLEILTGYVAGIRLRNNDWTTGSVNAEVQASLERLHKIGNDS